MRGLMLGLARELLLNLALSRVHRGESRPVQSLQVRVLGLVVFLRLRLPQHLVRLRGWLAAAI